MSVPTQSETPFLPGRVTVQMRFAWPTALPLFITESPITNWSPTVTFWPLSFGGASTMWKPESFRTNFRVVPFA